MTALIKSTVTADELAQGLQSGDPAVRLAAIGRAWSADSSALPAIAHLLVSDDPAVRKAAHEALSGMAYQPGQPQAEDRRKHLAAELAKLAGPENPLQIRLEALKLLEVVGSSEEVPRIAALLPD